MKSHKFDSSKYLNHSGITTKSQHELEQKIINSLVELPAYKPSNKDKTIFVEYLTRELANSMSKKDSETSSNNDELIKPNQLKIFWFSLKSLSPPYQKIGILTFFALLLGFLVRTSNPLLISTGFISLMVFYLCFLLYAIRLQMHYTNIRNIFANINKMIIDINQYIADYRIENETIPDKQAYIVLRDFIEDDISDLDYSWKKINLLTILFAFLLSSITVYILGDISVNTIKWLGKMFGLGGFEFISKLNAEKLATFILFPLGIAISKDIIINSLQRRNRLLRRSLAKVKRSIKREKIIR